MSFIRKPHKRDTCGQSHTRVDGNAACQGEEIFRESFDGNSLKFYRWNHEILMSPEPNYEFVVWDNNQLTSSVSDGYLKIKPLLYEDEFIRSGRQDLFRCTGHQFTDECVKTARGFSILPPVQSARITTKRSFSFKYGKVTVRAKLPVGDWIIPEIWLEPKAKRYGSSLSSGRIRLAFARGNQNLVTKENDKIGINYLQSGIIMGTPEKTLARNIANDLDNGWHSNFHNFTLIWEPDKISFKIDDYEQESIIEPHDGKLAELLRFEEKDNIWQGGSSIAPFDQDFYITLGLSVGGMKDFPDDCISGGRPKPWRNNAVKAMLNFWQDRDNWFKTWKDTASTLLIDEVTVHAL